MFSIQPGNLVHDANHPERGGTLYRLTKRRGYCLSPEGENIKIPKHRLAPGSPRRRKPPLTEAEVPGMEDAVKLCNCCKCGLELLGNSNDSWIMGWLYDRPKVADRIDGRPYCYTCLQQLIAHSKITPGKELNHENA